MSTRSRNFADWSRAAQAAANFADVDHLMRRLQPCGTNGGEADFFAMALSVVKRQLALTLSVDHLPQSFAV